MAGPNKKLVAAVEAYFADLRLIRASGGATAERSFYPALAGLLRAVGATLKPKVFCVLELADQGAGHPDGALYTARQVQKGRRRRGQVPERGVVEVKRVDDDAWVTAASDQVSRYWDRYGLVLVTNLRSFVLVGADGAGNPAKLETFRLAEDADDFWRKVETPRASAREVGAGLGEYLARALSHRAALAEPKDLAWLLASYARDGLARVEAAGNVSSLMAVRSAMEEALGIRFEGERGERFFRSTLIQTLFYGVFSAWVLWSRDEQKKNGPLSEGHYGPQRFRWREAVWHLRAPVLRALFQQLADPSRLRPLGLVEVLDWTSAALDRVDRTAFFARFNEGEAVPYFYEPFLAAFDPVLRKQLGVWYTPTEVVRYMVARVDKALKADLGIPAGLTAENVYVLDPCCGTGASRAGRCRQPRDRPFGSKGLHAGAIQRGGGCLACAGRQGSRCLSQRQGLLAQHPRHRLGLPAWRLSSAQEMAFVPRERALGPETSSRRDSALHRRRAADRRVTPGVIRRTREEAAMTEKLIDKNPDILGGTPVFSGTRVPVRILIEHLEAGDRLDDFLDDYPTVTREHGVRLICLLTVLSTTR